MSWRERYKNHEARFDQRIKAFQEKKKLSRQAIPMGSEAMFVSGMEDLDDFGTDKEDEGRRSRGKKPTRVDSDTEDEDWELARVQPRPTRKAMAAPEQPASKRKRVSDVSDRTPKRTRVVYSNGSRGGRRGSPTDGPVGGRGNDAMDQDSQGEETLEVEQGLFYPSDEDSLIILRWVAPSSSPVNRILIPIIGAAHQHGPPDRLVSAIQLRPLPRTSVLPYPYTDPTVLKTLPPAFSRQ